MKMGKLIVKDKDIVVPGEELANGMDYLPAEGAFRKDDRVIASYLGLVNINGRLIKIIPLSGRYVAKKGDTIIGEITDINFGGWQVDVGSSYNANLSLKDATSDFINKGSDLTQYYTFGDIVVANITNVIRNKIVDLTMRGPGLKKIVGGRIISIKPSKVPRVIGKQGTMISMIKDKTGCKIIVGQNGKVWISGDSPKQEKLAFDVIKLIEENAHIDGLTDKVKKYLEDVKV